MVDRAKGAPPMMSTRIVQMLGCAACLAVGCVPSAVPHDGGFADAGERDAGSTCEIDDPCSIYQSTYYDGVAEIVSGKTACTTDADCVAYDTDIACGGDHSMSACPIFIARDALGEAGDDLRALREQMCAPCFSSCGSFGSCVGASPACIDGNCVGEREGSVPLCEGCGVQAPQDPSCPAGNPIVDAQCPAGITCAYCEPDAGHVITAVCTPDRWVITHRPCEAVDAG